MASFTMTLARTCLCPLVCNYPQTHTFKNTLTLTLVDCKRNYGTSRRLKLTNRVIKNCIFDQVQTLYCIKSTIQIFYLFLPLFCFLHRLLAGEMIRWPWAQSLRPEKTLVSRTVSVILYCPKGSITSSYQHKNKMCLVKSATKTCICTHFAFRT